MLREKRAILNQAVTGFSFYRVEGDGGGAACGLRTGQQRSALHRNSPNRAQLV
jgi:hypothetical protein